MVETGVPEPPPRRLLEILEAHDLRPHKLVPLAGDVSLRRYFRLHFNGPLTAILATYPKELADSCQRFERTSLLLAEVGVRVPEIQLSLCRDGLMVVEDLGERTLYDLRSRTWEDLLPCLRLAVEMIGGIQSICPEAVPDSSPPLDAELLSTELRRTWELIAGTDGIAPGSLPPALEDAFDVLIGELSRSRQTPCHRDFMARNLVPINSPPGLAVIDHQDLRLGPATYDLASLLNDSLFPPPEIERALLDTVLGTPEERLDYHRAASQRTLKAVGTFLAFDRRGDARHRVLVAPTLDRARYHLQNLPEMDSVTAEIDELWGLLLGPGALS